MNRRRCFFRPPISCAESRQANLMFLFKQDFRSAVFKFPGAYEQKVAGAKSLRAS
jgi:hypothetical protein